MNNYVKVLMEARRLLEMNKHDWVCVLITVAAEKLKLREEGYELTQWIHQSISPETYVTGWLFRTHGIILDSKEERKAYRLAWIDNMIEAWSVEP